MSGRKESSVYAPRNELSMLFFSLKSLRLSWIEGTILCILIIITIN